MDQREIGLSWPIDSETLFDRCGNDLDNQLSYLLNFRADSIAADCEIVRKQLLGGNSCVSLLGHSYGGFCSISYLSLYPKSVKKVIIGGGIPPLKCTPDDVYAVTYRKTAERNGAYYRRYPEDVGIVHDICGFLSHQNVKLPNGGTLSVDRFQHFGITFGSTGGSDAFHQLVMKLHYQIRNFGKILYGTKVDIQNGTSFDTHILYFLFQEAIYCEGQTASNWAAERLRHGVEKNFDYATLIKSEGFTKDDIKSAVFFTGEMVYRSMYEDYAELRRLKPIAEALHRYKDWSTLYNKEALAENKVPAVAATYVDDQYVDFGLSMSAEGKIAGLKQHITSEFLHNGLLASPEVVLPKLFGLLEDDVI